MRRFDFQHFRQDPRFDGWYRRVSTQPGWVVRAALFAMVLIVAVPLALFVLAALFMGVVVFVLLSLVVRIVWFVQDLLGRGKRVLRPSTYSDGRRNVRVIRED